MATVTYTSREEIEVHKFSALATVAIPLVAIAFQSYFGSRFHFLQYFDIPLIVVVFFSVARRKPIAGLLTGTAVGLVQDALTHLPLGIFGISKSIVGYMASSIGVRMDVENPGSRVIMMFGFTLLHDAVYFGLRNRLLPEMAMPWYFGHELAVALANSLLAVVLFALMDRAKQR